ncbi:MAG: hybrid sensor histidine kinase/response regulator [Gemmataceae bacterium]
MTADFSLIDLFREEVRSQTATLSQGLLELESHPTDPRRIEPLMRAAHSTKGAARIVGLDPVVDLAHVMEDALVAAQHGKVTLTPGDIDVLLRGTDLLAELGNASEATLQTWGPNHAVELADLAQRFQAMAQGRSTPAAAPAAPPAPAPATSAPPPPRVVARAEPIEPGEEHPMFDLFREELRSGMFTLGEGLASLGQQSLPPEHIEPMVQAARGISGAARIVGLDSAAQVAAELESVLGDLQKGRLHLSAEDLQMLQVGTSLLTELVEVTGDQATGWITARQDEISSLHDAISALRRPRRLPPVAVEPTPTVESRELAPVSPPAVEPLALESKVPSAPAQSTETAEAVVRVTAQSLTRLMSLAGESLVQARWLQPFSMSLLKLKKHQDRLGGLLDTFNDALAEGRPFEQLDTLSEELRRQSALCRQVLAERIREFEDHAGQAEDLNTRLYREVIASRMRPFADGAHGFPRLVRDMARKLGKQVRLEIEGLHTEVDRDVLEKLEAPLTHLLRNAVDHGIEMPEDRRAARKDEQGVLRLEVQHRAGMLAILVQDDGRGVDVDRLRRKIVERGHTTAEMATAMSEAELLEFLFLPGFSTAREVTEFSGRGVGLDVVQDTIRKIGGAVRVRSRLGQGTTFYLQLPLTLSVLRAVLVSIAGEPYAFPHNRIDRLLRVERQTIQSLEHRQYVHVNGANVGLVLASQLLDLPAEGCPGTEVPVVLMSDGSGQYGLIVDAFQGEQDLVVRPLDQRLGKVPNVSAAAILDDGSPVLIVDVEDMIRSMDHFIQSGTLRRCEVMPQVDRRKKRILVVDDSITVREVERQLLRNAGYEVDVAVDGRDGWNQIRSASYDLLVSDVDMPRMNGLELVKTIRNHEPLRNLPIVIVSYKDREEDRLRGLELGANFYLTKSSFHDNRFLQVVRDLIGEA